MDIDDFQLLVIVRIDVPVAERIIRTLTAVEVCARFILGMLVLLQETNRSSIFGTLKIKNTKTEQGEIMISPCSLLNTIYLLRLTRCYFSAQITKLTTRLPLPKSRTKTDSRAFELTSLPQALRELKSPFAISLGMAAGALPIVVKLSTWE
jgi:hypothetical protein